MEFHQRERLVNRVISGQVRIPRGSSLFVVNNITPQIKYEASELYFDALEQASFYEVMGDNELQTHLLKNKLWTPAKQLRLDELPKEIEDLKVSIYESMTKGDDRRMYRERLNVIRTEYEKLYNELHLYDYLSQTGFAEYVKSKFILGKSLGLDTTLVSDAHFEQIMGLYNTTRLGEKEYRELARTEPWRLYWNLGKVQQLFSKPVTEYTEEQKYLCSWSRMYDNIYESQECPHDSIVEDDDMLDGWMIIGKRKREKDLQQKQGDEMISKNSRIRNSGEIYVMCQTQEDADKVDSLNDAYAKTVKRQRLLSLKERGEIKEADLPDVKQDLMIQANKMISNKVKGM